MLPGLCQLWQVLFDHFSDLLTSDNLDSDNKVYLFRKYLIILKHCLINIVDFWY